MSLVVGFQCDGSIRDTTEPCGGSAPCTNKVVLTITGAGYIGATDRAKALQERLEQQGWNFRGGYCYCPDHKS